MSVKEIDVKATIRYEGKWCNTDCDLLQSHFSHTFDCHITPSEVIDLKTDYLSLTNQTFTLRPLRCSACRKATGDEI